MGTPPANPPPAPPAPPIRILLVDDDEDDYLLTRDLLREIPDADLQLEWTSDEFLALEAMCANAYDLFLLDYRLGARTGIDLIREARDRGCHAPIILLTGLADRTLDFAAMQAGAADYLEKHNLDAAKLERSIRYTLQKQRYAMELAQKVQERTAELARTNATLQAEIAERVRAEEALREADRRKDEFLATLAHELRNPLAPIRNALEIMRIAHDRPEVVESSRAIIERQVAQLVRLVDDLLDLSRISRGKIRLIKERLALAEILDGAIEGSRPLIDKFGHRLTVSLPEEPIWIDGDRTRLLQLFQNLLNNAAKYTPSGGSIAILATREPPWAVIRVRDSGIGIEPEKLPKVFEMFSQIYESLEHSQGGLGIGLWLVRHLVRLHGGAIAVHSDGFGYGTTFTVSLPLATPEPVAPSAT